MSLGSAQIKTKALFSSTILFSSTAGDIQTGKKKHPQIKDCMSSQITIFCVMPNKQLTCCRD